MPTEVFIVIPIVVLVFAISLVVSLRRLAMRRAADVLARFQGKRVYDTCSSANFFGLESKGMAQVRGNGVLVLTGDVLFFQMWIPKRETEIPVARIRKVEQVRSHLGKTRGSPLVKVTFETAPGQLDSAAWLVPNPGRWQSAIEGLGRRAGD